MKEKNIETVGEVGRKALSVDNLAQIMEVSLDPKSCVAVPHESIDLIMNCISECANNMNKLLNDQKCIYNIECAANRLTMSLSSGGKVMICGNGGSAADAQHMAGEFLCRFYHEREPLSAIALSTDSSVLTSIANDYSYENVFSRQVYALGKAGDVLIGISTSGASMNIVRAFEAAKKKNITTILLTGSELRTIAGISDIVIALPATDTPRIQEMMLTVEHAICMIVEGSCMSGATKEGVL